MRLFARTAAAVLGIALLFAGILYATRPDAAVLAGLRDGDIVFQTSKDSQSLAVMLATKSLYSHVGVIDVMKNGKVMVLEAANPVRATPVKEWVAHGIGGRITVKRLKKEDAAAVRRALAWARGRMGRPYDPYFHSSDEAFYCSELVHDAFSHAGIKLGHEQKLSELETGSAAVQKIMKDRWQDHPVCRKGQKKTFESCIAAVMEEKLVTPESIARDGKLETVYSNYGGLE